jgi:hypothetical protein
LRLGEQTISEIDTLLGAIASRWNSVVKHLVIIGRDTSESELFELGLHTPDVVMSERVA